MNANRLLSHFERISDAPNAVDRLRRFILDLAVRGKLVEQDPGDASAEQLLGSRAVAAEPGQAPFPLPTGWAWTTLARIGESFGGGTPSKANSAYWQGDIPWVTPKDMKVCEITDAQDHISEAGVENSSARLIPAGAVLMVVRGMILAHSFPSAINRRPVTINQDMKAVVPFQAEMSQMLLLLMQGMKPQILALVKHSTHGTCKLLTDELFALLLPLPPLPEQHRIVAKVDELMKLCDKLEASQGERESRRDRLVVASLNRLSQPTDPDEFRKDAGFQLSNLNRLSTKPHHIKELRKAILNLAVRGKLVSQDEKEEPFAASDLGDGTGSAGRKRKGNLDLYQSEALCLPESWKALPLGALVEADRTISYGVLVPGPDAEGGVPFVRAQDLMLHSHPPRPNKTISPDVEKPYARTRLRGGEILLCVVGSIGKLGIVPEAWAGANIARAVARIAPRPPLDRDFLLLVLRESRVQEYFLKATRTLAQPTLNVGLIEKTEIPLPPLAEQKRIVAKLDELMLICDQLETQLESQQKGRRQLLEALLHEALEGVG